VFDLRAGSTIRVPANVRHNLENVGAETLVCLVAFSSGNRETVFLET
jgi:mannose-6-phosphate isomerase-like protein (cupin superfamily)